MRPTKAPPCDGWTSHTREWALDSLYATSL